MRPRCSGSIVGRAARLFPNTFARLAHRPSTVSTDTNCFILPSRNSPSEFLHSADCLGLSTLAACLGLCPLLTSSGRVHSREAPTPHFVPSSGDHNLSTVYSATRLADVFHPAASIRALHPCRGLSSPCSGAPLSGDLASLMFPYAPSPANRLPGDANVNFEAFIHTQLRVIESAVKPQRWSLPSAGSFGSPRCSS
jgi:hypothetical protein